MQLFRQPSGQAFLASCLPGHPARTTCQDILAGRPVSWRGLPAGHPAERPVLFLTRVNPPPSRTDANRVRYVQEFLPFFFYNVLTCELTFRARTAKMKSNQITKNDVKSHRHRGNLRGVKSNQGCKLESLESGQQCFVTFFFTTCKLVNLQKTMACSKLAN